MKTFCPKQSQQCVTLFYLAQEMGDAKNAMATTVNLILYYMIPPELAER
jgi:hypothetical protein